MTMLQISLEIYSILVLHNLRPEFKRESATSKKYTVSEKPGLSVTGLIYDLNPVLWEWKQFQYPHFTSLIGLCTCGLYYDFFIDSWNKPGYKENWIARRWMEEAAKPSGPKWFNNGMKWQNMLCMVICTIYHTYSWDCTGAVSCAI